MEQKYYEVVSVRTDDISLHLKGFLQARSGPGTRQEVGLELDLITLLC